MKKIKSLHYALIVLVVFGLISCQDETRENMQDSSKLVELHKSNDKDVENAILSFNAALQSKNENQTVYQLDDALWLLEAGLNYNYCSNMNVYKQRLTDSLMLNLEKNAGGLIDFADVQVAYDEMVSHMSAAYHSIADEEKMPIVADIDLIEHDAGNVVLKLKAVFGYELANTAKNLNDFGSTAWWKWGLDLGKCNGYTGTGDAANEIDAKLYFELIQPVGTYFTDVEPKYDIKAWNYPNPDDDNPNDGYFDYLMFCSGNHNCLSPDEMNFHWDGSRAVIYMYESDGGPRPAGKDPIDLDLEGELIPGSKSNTYFHMFYEINYGVKHYSGGGGRLKSL